MSLRFEKDWFKKFTKILKRCARDKNKRVKCPIGRSIKVIINVLNF